MPDTDIDKAVILAAGLGTRMRKTSADAHLSQAQARVADSGVKALIPIDRPFLDYVLTTLADAGYRRICLVIGPEHDELREYYGHTLQPKRLTIEFAVQPEPLGTANAVQAVEAFAGGGPFVVLNSDNHYPLESMQALRTADGPALPGFQREGLITLSNIPAERILRFAICQTDADGYLTRIIEKPDPATVAALAEPICVSMNVFRFGPAIFDACGRIGKSSRGEYELPNAVQYALEHMGERFRVLPFNAPVLDLSSRADVEPVTRMLAGMEVRV
jgi:glucose-1-phosphate thymidylyltransferase